MSYCTTAVLTIIAAALVHYLIGSVWFVAFKDPYLKGLGKTAKEMKKGPTIVQASVLHIIATLAMAFILRFVITTMHAHGAWEGMQVAAMMWLGFICAVIGPMYAYQAYSLRFFIINAGYQLVGILAMGAVIGITA